MRTIAWDTETHQIGPGAVAPRIVCMSLAFRNGLSIETRLLAQGDDLKLHVEALMRSAIYSHQQLITHNGGYDYACVCATWPELIPLVFEALASGNCRDTLWDEKLLNLSTTGRLDGVTLPDGSTLEIRYSLADLELRHIGRDRSAEKVDHEESWRIHYGMLDGWKAEEFPEDAARYAKEDAEGTLLVHEAQQSLVASRPSLCSVATGPFQLYSSFCLYLETAWGMATNREEIARMRRDVDRVLAAHRDLLEASGVLRSAVGPRPHKTQMARAIEIVGQMGVQVDQYPDFDWAPYVDRLKVLGIRFTAPVEESTDMKRLQEVAADAYRRCGAIPTLTDGRVVNSERVRGIKLGDEETEFLATVCPIMAQYHVRKSLRKMATNQLPILESAPVIHFRYDALKETTRTSSSGNAKGKPALFPAANGQQVPKAIEGGDVRVDPRRGYMPRPGTAFFDVDLHCLELACVGQKTHDLFGYSVHLERYNAGWDLHANLATSILLSSATEGVEREAAQEIAAGGDAEGRYKRFVALKKHERQEFREIYKNYRNLAKPIGLGFPGGIGPAKMVTLARVQYGVIITEPRAYALREMWRATYTEMVPYFDWVSSQVDHHNVGPLDENGRPVTLYWYTTPMGAIRRGCTFCSEANGAAMQSPGAEVAKAGNNAVVRACYDVTRGSVLLGARPIAFVHDQIIGETTRDQPLWHEQAMEVSRLMIDAARPVLPKVRMRTEPLLTRVWSKSAEPVFDGAGRLIPWQPKQEK